MSKNSTRSLKQGKTLEKSKPIFAKIGIPNNSNRIIHVAGTSGKGSTAMMIEAIIRQHGYSTGLILSPHIYDIRERFQIDGELLSRDETLSFATKLNQVIPETETQSIGYFLYLLLLGMFAQNEKKVDFNIIETGLGGRLDFTNINNQPNKLCVLTRIGKDHTKILGETYKKIASEKAGIIYPGNQVVALNQRQDVNDVFRQYSDRNKAKLYFVKEKYKNMKIQNKQLYTDYQRENIALAVEACRVIANMYHFKLDDEKIVRALNDLRIPGRLEEVKSSGNTYIFDISHNEQKLKALRESVNNLYPNRSFTFVFAMKSDKNYQSAIKAIAPVASRIVFTRFTGAQDMDDKSIAPLTLAKFAKTLALEAEVADSAAEALNTLRKEDINIITGSTYLVSEFRSLIDN